MPQVNEINSIGNRLCSECWSKLEAFHEFYQMVEVTHRSQSRLKNKDGKHAVKVISNGAATNDSKKEIKLETSHDKQQPVTIKNKMLKLNSNTPQPKEVKLHIEKTGKKVRCNIVEQAKAVKIIVPAANIAMHDTVANRQDTKTVDIKSNGPTNEESESESELQQDDVPNYPIPEIKMEQELIIIDDDNCASPNDVDAHTHAKDIQQSRKRSKPTDVTTCNVCFKGFAKSHLANHQSKKHNICKDCKQMYSTRVELTIHRLRCDKVKKNQISCCQFCGRCFTHRQRSGYLMHLRKHEKNTELNKKTSNEKWASKNGLGSWASMLSQK